METRKIKACLEVKSFTAEIKPPIERTCGCGEVVIFDRLEDDYLWLDDSLSEYGKECTSCGRHVYIELKLQPIKIVYNEQTD